MSCEVALSLRGVTKRYRVFRRPLDRVREGLALGLRRFHDHFTALQGLDLDILPGETVGVVGRNGSGKSTLLQLVSGILKPSEGEIKVSGRVSALLELGAGFHGDFTGRENAYFLATLLGLDSRQAAKRFPDIERFAGIGPAIDQPVHTYSSGMFVRLAFAVAVSVEPDILVIDEALAVGDEAFQRKCFAHLRAFQARGGTLLLVSHSPGTILDLCDRVLLLEAGRAEALGPPKLVLDHYHRLLFGPSPTPREGAPTAQPTDSSGESPPDGEPIDAENFSPELVPASTVPYQRRGAEILNPRLLSMDGKRVNLLSRGSHYIYAYEVVFTEAARDIRFGMLVKTTSGTELGGIVTPAPPASLTSVSPGLVTPVRIPFRCNLLPGSYFLNAGVQGSVGHSTHFLHRILDAAMFRVKHEPGLGQTGLVDLAPCESGN